MRGRSKGSSRSILFHLSLLVSIGDYAFRDCPFTSVTFPEGLQSIRDGAFSGCPLTSVVVPDLKTSIHCDAFSGCPACKEEREKNRGKRRKIRGEKRIPVGGGD